MKSLTFFHLSFFVAVLFMSFLLNSYYLDVNFNNQENYLEFYESDLVQSISQDTFFLKYYDLFNQSIFQPMDSIIENHGLNEWIVILNNFKTCANSNANKVACLGLVGNLKDQIEVNHFFSEGETLLDSLRSNFSNLDDSAFVDSIDTAAEFVLGAGIISFNPPSNPEAVPCYRAYVNSVFEAKAELISDVTSAIMTGSGSDFVQAFIDYYFKLHLAHVAYCNCMMDNYGQSPC